MGHEAKVVHCERDTLVTGGFTVPPVQRPRRGDCLCDETAAHPQQRAVIGRGCCSTGRRLPQFKQANTVMTRPALRSTARSYNIVPWHLSQVFMAHPNMGYKSKLSAESPFSLQKKTLRAIHQ